MFIGIIYDPSYAEGTIEGHVIISNSLEDIKNSVSSKVDAGNEDLDYVGDGISFSWTDGATHQNYYPVDLDKSVHDYGKFVWAQVKEVEEGRIYKFSEYGTFNLV